MTLNIPILYEDADVVVLNKPPGVVVNQASTHTTPTLQEWLTDHLATQPTVSETNWNEIVPIDFDPEFGSPQDVFEERHGLVHRLDKDTSGAIVMAKNPGSLVALLRQFKRRETEKKYLALVHGKVQAPQATLSFPIGRSSLDRKTFSVKPDGRTAETKYKVLKRFSALDLTVQVADLITAWQQLHPHEKSITQAQLIKRFSIYQGFSLVECWPKTGRTHQIRVHMAHIRHPLVADATYSGKKRQQLDPLWCPRQFLHAQELSFMHPRTKLKMTITAPLWPDLDAVLGRLSID